MHDNEIAVLAVEVPSNAAEGDGLLSSSGTVRVDAAVDDDVVVWLTSSDATEVAVPAAVTIPAGQTSAVFDLTIADDGEIDGTQTVTIGAAVTGWTSASASIDVSDNEIMDLALRFCQQPVSGPGTWPQPQDLLFQAPIHRI